MRNDDIKLNFKPVLSNFLSIMSFCYLVDLKYYSRQDLHPESNQRGIVKDSNVADACSVSQIPSLTGYLSLSCLSKMQPIAVKTQSLFL